MLSYGALAHVYDQLMDGTTYDQWVDYADRIWQHHSMKPRTIVDLGCGTGNIALPLAERGCHVVGIDLSADMLAIARSKQEQLTSSAKLDIHWIEQDMAAWSLPQQVDTVISFCDSLNYLLEEQDLARTFKQTYEGLRPGGLFIFDVHTRLTFETYAKEQPFTVNEEDIAYIWHCYLDEARHEIEHELTIFVKDQLLSEQSYFRRIDEWHCQRAYDLLWMKETLQSTGFDSVDCFGDFTMNPADEQTRRAFFVAKKSLT